MIQEITLTDTLPHVFRGMEKTAPVCNSQVWLHEVSFRRPGYYMIEAESGTGKSSLCSFIFGVRGDYQGTVAFDGRDVRTFSIDEWCALRTRALAYLPQEMHLFPELTVMENIMIKNRLTDCRSGVDTPCARTAGNRRQSRLTGSASLCRAATARGHCPRPLPAI